MSIDAMKLALEALEYFSDTATLNMDKAFSEDAITALRQAIEQAQKQDPLDLQGTYTGQHIGKEIKNYISTPQEQAQKSNEIDVLKIAMDSINHHAKELWKCRARIQQLEQAQKQEPDDLHIAYMSGLHRGKELAQRQPLTVDEVWQNDELMALNAQLGCGMDLLMEIVEVIEAAHGIKE